MFYSQVVLAKKGPLGKIWLAGHYSQHKKLNKQQIFSTNITLSVGTLLCASRGVCFVMEIVIVMIDLCAQNRS
jgi:hypothetical protein